MKLPVSYELQYAFPQPTPAILMLNIHFTRVAGLAAPDHIVVSPAVPISGYRDGFGNWCCRIVAPKGKVSISTDALITDTGRLDQTVPDAAQIPVESLKEEALVFRSATPPDPTMGKPISRARRTRRSRGPVQQLAAHRSWASQSTCRWRSSHSLPTFMVLHVSETIEPREL